MHVRSLCCTVLIAVAFGAAVPGRAQVSLDQLRQQAKERAQQQEQQRQQQQQQRQQQQQQQRPGQPGSPGSQPAAPAAQALNANVQTALMGPTVGGASTDPLYMSDDGNHLAIQTVKGSRQVIMVDGVEGPVFDEFPPRFGLLQLPTRLSPSGGRSAYVGRRGGDYIAVVDGKEAATVFTASRMGGVAAEYIIGWDFWFSRDGSRLAYAVLNETGSWSMMVDGIKGQAYPAFDLRQTVLNGKRLAYVAQTPDKKWHVVVDGKQGPGYDAIQSLKMTPDGAHYAFFATGPGSTSRIVVDGVEGKPYGVALSDMELAPDGRVAYMASLPFAGGASPVGCGPAVLVLGGQEIPNTSTFSLDQGPGGHVSFHVAFSPDGKRVAYVKQNVPSTGLVVVVDGKAGPEYSTINLLQFSPDGRRLFYMAGAANGLIFPVIDGQELQGDNTITNFQFSPDGKRYAFRTWQNGVFAVDVDGKDSPKYKGDIYAQSLTFSPDSKHYAYGAALNITSFQPVVDGEVRNANLAIFQTISNPDPTRRVTFPVFNYSPDGNRLAFVGQKLDGTSKASLNLDGVAYEGATTQFSFPSFSPDSKHFAWLNWTSPGWTLMVDGKAGPAYQNILENSIAGCRFVDDHTFRFYGVKDGLIYRVTVDIGN